MNKKKLFMRNLSIRLKKRIVKSVLWSLVLDAAESWTVIIIIIKNICIALIIVNQS